MHLLLSNNSYNEIFKYFSKSALTINSTKSSSFVFGIQPSFLLAFVASPINSSTYVGR